MFSDKLINEIKSHVMESPMREICGLVVTNKRKPQYVPCRNIAAKNSDFEIHPEDFADASDKYEIVCVVHSHIGINPNPSQADLIEIERNQLPYLIFNYPTLNYTYTEPSGYEAPYVGRKFVHGITDCYAIWRDFYKREFGIEMQNYHRDSEWWLKSQNLYLDNYKDAGFREVNDLQYGDIILMRVASQVPNHCAVYVGNNSIIHHIMGKLSSKDIYGGYWQKITAMILRHESR